MEKEINRIKAVLAEKNRTSKWLAEQLNKDPATVSKWCTNSSQPSIEVFIKIAELWVSGFSWLVSFLLSV